MHLCTCEMPSVFLHHVNSTCMCIPTDGSCVCLHIGALPRENIPLENCPTGLCWGTWYALSWQKSYGEGARKQGPGSTLGRATAAEHLGSGPACVEWRSLFNIELQLHG